MNVLVIDIGGSHVRMLATGQDEARKFSSGNRLALPRGGWGSIFNPPSVIR